MRPHLLAGQVYNPGDQSRVEPEAHVDGLRFTQFKFTRRPKPEDPRRILLIPSFGEFGCEVVASMYIIPRLVQRFPGYYSVVIGWHGRDYLYRHLVDEFWELGAEHQWLREYCRAFHHKSVNLERFERSLRGTAGFVVSPDYMARQALGTECRSCQSYWKEDSRSPTCRACGQADLRKALFHDMPACWADASLPPAPSPGKVAWARGRLPANPVGVFARSRKCYGRNLSPRFYLDLIDRLRAGGYEPVWLGEPSTTLPCPDPTVTDFTTLPEQGDLEATLAIIGQLRFTIQFWTASTRLSAMAGTPFILFESPDQIWGNGQEGFRLELVSRGGPRKVVANHYLNVVSDPGAALDILMRSVGEVERGDFEDALGLVDVPEQAMRQRTEFHAKVRAS